jgi:hypothetical protein
MQQRGLGLEFPNDAYERHVDVELATDDRGQDLRGQSSEVAVLRVGEGRATESGGGFGSIDFFVDDCSPNGI